MPQDISEIEQEIDNLPKKPGHVTRAPIEEALPYDESQGAIPYSAFTPTFKEQAMPEREPSPIPPQEYPPIPEEPYTTSSGVGPLPEPEPTVSGGRIYKPPIEEAYPEEQNPYEEKSFSEVPLEPEPEIDNIEDLKKFGQRFPPNKRNLGTGEPVYLYIETAPGVYELKGQFNSKVEASQEVDKNWTGATYKALTAKEAVAEQEKMQAKAERVHKSIEKIEKGAGKVGAGAKKVFSSVTRRTGGEPRPPGSPSLRSQVAKESSDFGQHFNETFTTPEKPGTYAPPHPFQQKSLVGRPTSKYTFNPSGNTFRLFGQSSSAPSQSPIKSKQSIARKSLSSFGIPKPSTYVATPKSRTTITQPRSGLSISSNPKRSNLTVSPREHPFGTGGSLNPPRKPLAMPYNVRQRHGTLMFTNEMYKGGSSLVRPYRIPVTRLFPNTPHPAQQVQKSIKPKKHFKHKRRK